MSDPFDHHVLPEDELIAAELALGVLDAAARTAAQARAARDPVFAHMVTRWEDRLAPWSGEIIEQTPSPAVWDRIAAALPPERKTTDLWQSLIFWRRLSLAAGALAAACVGALIYFGAVQQAPQQGPLIATIDGNGRHHFVATLDTRRRSIAVVPAAFVADTTRVPELWLIPADGKPRSLGLLQGDRAVTMTIPHELAAYVTREATLAVSLEPQGGSPTGQPTGPVIGAGKLTLL